MKKCLFKSVLMVISIIAIMGGFAVSGWSADRVMIKAASEYPDKHPTVKNGWFPWIENLKKETKGQLIIQFFNPNTLVPQKDAWAALETGAADMIFNPTWRNQGKFPLDDVTALPMLFNGAEAGSLTIWDLYQTYPEWRAEYKDVKLLWQWTSATIQLHTRRKLVKNLADFKGMKIIGWNPRNLEMIKALGANPIEMSPPDTYLALERGMADGVMCPIAPMRAFKIADAVKYHTIINLNCDAFYAAVNWKKFNGMPDKLKKALENSTGRRMAQISGKTLDQGAIADANWMKKKGQIFYVLPKAEKQIWRDKLKYMDEDWIAAMEKRGYKNARSIYNETLKLAEKYSSETVGGYKQ
ncbi:MAG: TRAP transporter substrate-binding protein DctP [Desulfatiglandaceae bacterium]